MAQHAGYYSPNLDKNTTTIPGQVKYTIAGMRYYAPDKTVTIYLQGTGNGKKRSASLYSDDVYVVECRKFTSASAAVNNLVRNAKPQHKSLLSQPSIQKKIIAELNEDYYDLAGRPQHSGYYSPNIGYDPYFEHSDDEDEVIDMTEIEDTIKHSNSESQQYKLDKVYYSGVAGVPNSAEITFKPIGTNIGAQGKKTLVIRAETIKNISSIQELKSLIERRYKAELEDKSSLYTSSHSLAPGEAAKAASKIWITFGRGGESSVRHSAFNDQLASNDDKAKYYKYMSGKYDPKTKNVTLKFSNGLYNVQVVCQGPMYGRVNSLPEMKEYVQNAFYAEVGAHKYLDSSNASKAAVYLWDAKNAHFGKANPMSRLQHSAFTVVPAYDEDYLEHHGILGMKWGVRRYQNEDGSLTDAGRKRYGVQSSNASSISSKKGIQTRLNDLDTAMARNTRHSREMGQAAMEYNRKANKLLNKTSDKAQNKRNEYIKKAEESRSKQKEYDDNIKKGYEETQKLLKEAVDQGYTVGRIETSRSTMEGKDVATAIAITAATLPLTALTGAPFYTIVLPNAAERGTKYTLKDTKEGETARVEDRKRSSMLVRRPNTIDQAIEEGLEERAHREAARYGLDQSDNYKVFRDAMNGDAEAQRIVDEWKRKKK